MLSPGGNAMPLSEAFEDQALVKRVLRLRSNPIAAYGVALGMVGLATLLRWAVGAYAMEGIPFITYYAAIIVAALVGGLWPGIVSTALSAVLAWYLFLPPTGGWDLDQREMVSLLLF